VYPNPSCQNKLLYASWDMSAVKFKMQYRHPEHQILSSILTENINANNLLGLAKVINETFPTYAKNRNTTLQLLQTT
jgi:hypothetical protein